VAVVVPVKDRRDLLRETLAALDRQEHGDFEVLVVDDGSTDGSDELAASTQVAGRPVRVLRSDGSGAVAARTVGVAATDADILAFTDSDCVPAPDWLAIAVRRIGDGAALVHGRTIPARQVMPLERSVTETGAGLFPTCNLAVARSAYDAVGGFDADAHSRLRFRRSSRAKGLGFGEDTLFGWAIARRSPAVYDEDMVVRHHVFPADLRETIGRSWQMGAFPALVREVPELRRTLVRRGVLFGGRSRVPLYATLAAVLARRPRLVAMALLWWALHRLRYSIRGTRLPLREQVEALPAQMLVDVVQASALVAGSARARVLLL
jgi:glycosyltransferase involved in cell wall biosynthesis